MSEFVVSKMGGTSMAQPEVVASLVESQPQQQLIVVSAPGVDTQTDEKVTNMLATYGHVARAGDIQKTNNLRDEIIDRFDFIYAGLDTLDRRDLRTRANVLMTPAHNDDSVYYMHLGEVLSAWGFARLIGASCLAPAVEFAGSGQLDRDRTAQAIQKQMADVNSRVIVPGFFGHDEFNRVWLLGRGGSDRTGALYAAALGWDYENWTDVDGIYSADPRVVANARVLPELTREEVREGAHGGTGVLMGDTLVDLNGSDVTTTVKNTFNPAAAGTRIVPKRQVDPSSSIVAISGRTDLREISIRDMGMANEPGYVSTLLKEFSRLGLSLQHMPTAQDSLSITTVAETAQELKAIDEFMNFAGKNALSASASVEVFDKGVVYVVGERLRDPSVRTLAYIRLLGDIICAGYGVEDVVSNRLSPSIALLVEPEAVDPIIRTIHAREIAHDKKLFR